MSWDRAFVALLAIAATFAAAAVPAAANKSSCTADLPPAASPRIVRPTVDGLTMNVLLPSDYATSGRRYPVLYLLHGGLYNENTWLDQSDVERFTRPFEGDQAAIVVMPDGGPMGFYADWHDGTEQWESYHLNRLLPYIDTHFRTIADGAHRAAAGFSLGGFGALVYAARHPELFAVAGSFSGLADLAYPEANYYGAGSAPLPGAGSPSAPQGDALAASYHPPDDEMSGCQGSGDTFGDRVLDPVQWHNHNPTDLASNLRGIPVYLAAGSGVPCGPQDTGGSPSLLPWVEPFVRETTKRLDTALTVSGVEHFTDFYACGLHTMLYAQRDLHRFWPYMLGQFGRELPTPFNFRNADKDFSVRGWSFRADPARGIEFLEVRKASNAGFTLTGSGTETVVTPGIYTPGQQVDVTGAKPAIATADGQGRIRLAVDLGPAHTKNQFRRLARPPVWQTRVVSLTPH
jgi:S-formylglutathione hydrolase FrmB